MEQAKKKLDTVVKLALGVFIGSFVLIGLGMFLSRPDRSIPPYSIGSQEGTAVALHVPPWTSDPAIEALLHRFRKIRQETGDFGSMKIRPTTPEDSGSRYRRIVVYIFTEAGWTEPEILHQYLTTTASGDQTAREKFEKAVRGVYRLDDFEEEGRIGPILNRDTAGTAAYARVLFKERLTPTAFDQPGRSRPAGTATTARSPAPQTDVPAGRGR